MRRNHYNGLGGFSSHAANMIGSFKTNFRKKELNLLKGSRGKFENKKILFKTQATPKQLNEIREKLQKENKKQLRIRIALILILLIIIIYVIGFVKI